MQALTLYWILFLPETLFRAKSDECFTLERIPTDTYPHPHHYLSFSSVLFWDEIMQIDSYPDCLAELRSSFLKINKLGYKQNIICSYAMALVACLLIFCGVYAQTYALLYRTHTALVTLSLSTKGFLLFALDKRISLSEESLSFCYCYLGRIVCGLMDLPTKAI